MNNSKQFLTIARICCRNYSQPAETVAPQFKRLKNLQKKFGIEDGTPVYIKGGFADKALYGATVLLTTVGLGMALDTFYQLEFGKKS